MLLFNIFFSPVDSLLHNKWVPVTTAWRVLGLRMEERTQPKRGGPPAWGLGEVLTTLHRKNVSCYESFIKASDLVAGTCECGNEPWFGCKTNARVNPAKTGHGPHSSYFLYCSMYFCVVLCIVCFVSFSVLFVCICVLYYCHRVATQFQLSISYHKMRGTSLLVEDQLASQEGLHFME